MSPVYATALFCVIMGKRGVHRKEGIPRSVFYESVVGPCAFRVDPGNHSGEKTRNEFGLGFHLEINASRVVAKQSPWNKPQGNDETIRCVYSEQSNEENGM
jgi:hypothetical protein